MSEIFDPGLQPERTSLAWRRTGLAMLVGSLTAARILSETLGAWAATIGLAGAVAAGVLLFTVHRRYAAHHSALMRAGERAPIAGGVLVALTALFAVVAGLVSLAMFGVLVTRGH